MFSTCAAVDKWGRTACMTDDATSAPEIRYRLANVIRLAGRPPSS